MPALLRQTSTVSATAVFTQGRPERRAPPPPPSQGDRLRTAQVHERRCTSAGARAQVHATLPYPIRGATLMRPAMVSISAFHSANSSGRLMTVDAMRAPAARGTRVMRPRQPRPPLRPPQGRAGAGRCAATANTAAGSTPTRARWCAARAPQGPAGSWGGAGRAVHGRVAVHRARDALDLAQHALGRARIGQHKVDRARALRVQPCARAGRVTARAEQPRAASSLPGPAARRPAQPRRPMQGARGCGAWQAHCARGRRWRGVCRRPGVGLGLGNPGRAPRFFE